MSTDPLLNTGESYSINSFEANGTQTAWEFNFAGGYVSREHVKAYSVSPSGVAENLTYTWVGPNTINITPAVPDGYTLTIYRDTPKVPVVDFSDGSVINEVTLDLLASQSVFTAAEMVDRLGVVRDVSDEALFKANLSITFSEAVAGGDFTKFARTHIANDWGVAQNFLTGTTLDGEAIATQSYVTSAISPLATSASVTSAIATAVATAATDATGKANAAQAAAIAAATAADVALRNEIDPDWLYTLAAR